METVKETGVCKLEISDATADDSGEYTVQLDNDVIIRLLSVFAFLPSVSFLSSLPYHLFL